VDVAHPLQASKAVSGYQEQESSLGAAPERRRPLQVRIQEGPKTGRPKIVHAIANMMTGGPSLQLCVLS